MVGCARGAYKVLPPEGHRKPSKGKKMPGAGSTWTTLFGKAGTGVRKVEGSRRLAALVFLAVIFAGICLFGGNDRTIATLGLPVVLIVAAGIFHLAKTLGYTAEEHSGSTVDAPGAPEEEAGGSPLGELPAGFHVVDGFVSRKGRIDHILVSTKGIFTVGTKSGRGVVECDAETLTRDGNPFEEDIIRQAMDEAYSIRDHLTDNGVCNLRPQPVIVFTHADVQVKRKVRGVHVVGREELRAFLEGLPAWMSERLSKGIIDCLSSTRSR
jgi:hypothetical protein